eukprot:COSAG06_NODE_692_length_13043_cov_369.439509_9_plen_61_part_00
MAELGQQAAAFSRPSPPAAEIVEKLGLQGTILYLDIYFWFIACCPLYGFSLYGFLYMLYI